MRLIESVRTMEEKIKYYMSLPYTRIVNPVHDEAGDYFVGNILEFDGCMSTGNTVEETYKSLEEAMQGWLAVHLEFGDPIPEALSGNDYNGKYALRLPPVLQRKLAIEAKLQGISFNQYALYKLSK